MFWGQNSEWVTLEYGTTTSCIDDWIGVFSPANFSMKYSDLFCLHQHLSYISIFSSSICLPECPRAYPLLCTAPIKFQFANYSSAKYKDTGKGTLKLQIINQRSDFSFALFSGGVFNYVRISLSLLFLYHKSCKLAIFMDVMTVGDECCNAWCDAPKLVAVSNTVVFANPKGTTLSAIGSREIVE
ncbi:putative inactive purple acid phosphatase 1 [Drosera capensis]